MDTPIPPAEGSARTPLIPQDQNELATLATRVAKSYATAPAKFVLDWKTPAEATQLALDLTAAVEERDQQDALREGSSGRLGILTRELNKGTTQLKAMINEEWEEDAEAESHYAEFGLVRENDNDVLPAAQAARATAIEKLLLPALLAHGMGGRKYGTAWWKTRLTEYQTLTGGRQEDTQEISATVGTKAPLMLEARAYLGRLDALLYANTRTQDEYLAQRRAMGFLKEYK